MTYSDLTRRVERKLKRIRRKQQLRATAIMLAMLLVLSGILYLVGVHVARPWLDKLDNMGPMPVASGVVVTIAPKETLWSIASQYYPGEHTGEIVMQIRKLNPGLDPGALQVGQKVVLPEVG